VARFDRNEWHGLTEIRTIEAGFDFNSATNGFSIDNALHGSHKAYNEYVSKRLSDWASQNKGYSPKDAREFIQNKLIPELEDMVKAVQEKGTQTLNAAFKEL
jgi:hypothetical protein